MKDILQSIYYSSPTIAIILIPLLFVGMFYTEIYRPQKRLKEARRLENMYGGGI